MTYPLSKCCLVGYPATVCKHYGLYIPSEKNDSCTEQLKTCQLPMQLACLQFSLLPCILFTILTNSSLVWGGQQTLNLQYLVFSNIFSSSLLYTFFSENSVSRTVRLTNYARCQTSCSALVLSLQPSQTGVHFSFIFSLLFLVRQFQQACFFAPAESK